MSNTIRVKRRAAGGAAGAPASLATSEPAYNEQDDIVYIGYGDNGAGVATTIRAIAGAGAFMGLVGNQSIAGVKTFASFPITPSSAPTTDYQVANKKYVDDAVTGGSVTDGDKGDIVVSSSGAVWSFDTSVVTAFAKTLLDDANQAAMRTTLGLTPGTDVQAYDVELAAIAGLTSAADRLAYFTGSGTASLATFTSFARSLLDDVDAATARTTLGLAIGTNVQAYDAELAAIAGLTSAADKGIQFTGSGAAATFDLTAAGKALLDDADAAAQRGTLGLVIGTNVQAYSSVLAATTASFLTAHETKLGHISVTQAVDLDAIESRVNALDAAVILKGTWDASAGTFPGSGAAQAGESWIVSVAGTVNSTAFGVGDRIIAIADNASTTVFAANWFKADYTDQVLSVAGRTGAVTLAVADITDMSANGRSLTSAADYAAMRTLLGLVIGTNVQAYDADLAALAGLTSAANKGIQFTGSGTAATYDLTAAGKALLDDADAAAQRTTLGLGTIATQAATNVAISGGTIDGVVLDGGTF